MQFFWIWMSLGGATEIKIDYSVGSGGKSAKLKGLPTIVSCINVVISAGLKAVGEVYPGDDEDLSI
jgi:hypothetical protein